jgi:adenylate kinase family enzyme
VSESARENLRVHIPLQEIVGVRSQVLFSNRGEPGTRVTVIGTSGSGKTTMARALAQRLAVPHIELDELHWGPNWTEEPDEVFRERVDRKLVGEGWTADGNYAAVRDIVWGRADTVVWLDYSLPLILWRLTRRTFSRAVLNEEIWHGNKESLHTHFFTKDSLYLWVLQTYRKRRREYPVLLAQPEYAQLKKIRLGSVVEAQRWLAGVERKT